ncbi:uncharacterized protein LOC144115734 isoform X1 [Amblyomma americanum]
MSPLSRLGAVLVCARSAYIAEHNCFSIINRTMAATCSWYSGQVKSKKSGNMTAGVSELKVEKAMYDTMKGIPKVAVLHKRTATTIWSEEAVVQCSSSGKCSGDQKASTHWGETADEATKLIMKTLLKTPVALRNRLKGQNEKEAFENLRLYSAIVDDAESQQPP